MKISEMDRLVVELKDKGIVRINGEKNGMDFTNHCAIKHSLGTKSKCTDGAWVIRLKK